MPPHRCSLALLALLTAPVALAQQPFEVVPTPNNGPDHNVLRGIDARAADDVWAVGDWYEPPTDPFQAGELRTLAMRWDGAGWTTVPTPNPVQGGNGLWDVAAIAPDLAWAVGHKGGNGAKPMVLRWDGTSWAEFDIPPPSGGFGGGTGILLGMHDLAADDIWAVGTAGSPSPGASFAAIAYHWDGASWELTIPPFVTDFHHELDAVHGSAPDNVWAVGSWGETYGRYRPLVYRWDGEQWNVMPAPFNEDPSMPLMAVQVLGLDDVWVTADRIATGDGPVTAHWDGTSWTEYANPGGTGALVAIAPDDIYGFGVNVTRWDGTSWAVVDEIEEREYPSLGDATSLPDGTLWAAGRWVLEDGSSNSPLRTLAVRGQVAPAPVAVAVEPVGGPVVVGPGGGSFQFTVTLTNTTDEPQTFEAWTAVTGPFDREPVLGPLAVTLPPGAAVTRTLTQRVPGAAPAGTYNYVVSVGVFPDGATASAAFPVAKQPGLEVAARDAYYGGGASEWAASGWEEDSAPVAASVIPASFDLGPAAPNPAPATAGLSLALPEPADVLAEAYDLLGRRVATLADGPLAAGTHALVFDGSALAAGAYVVRATVRPERGALRTFARRIMLVR